MSFKPEVSVDGGRSFQQNNLAFATREEAETSARDLMGRWMLVTDWRVIESDQPINYRIRYDGALESAGSEISEGAGTAEKTGLREALSDCGGLELNCHPPQATDWLVPKELA